MTISEAQRFEMHLGLRKALGDDVANSLMEHLPPSGWSDVARTSDIDHLHLRIDHLEARLDRLEVEMREGFQGIKSSMRLMVGSMVAVSIGIIVMLVQLNQTMAGL
jgi:uncharacterized membrane protein YjjP (DUF1212 family)